MQRTGEILFLPLEHKIQNAIFSWRAGNGYRNLICVSLETAKNKYMLFAGWEVRIVKNCDRGLENAARGRRTRAAFSRPRSQFFTIRTDPKPVNNLFIFFLLGKKKVKRLSCKMCLYYTRASNVESIAKLRQE